MTCIENWLSIFYTYRRKIGLRKLLDLLYILMQKRNYFIHYSIKPSSRQSKKSTLSFCLLFLFLAWMSLLFSSPCFAQWAGGDGSGDAAVDPDFSAYLNLGIETITDNIPNTTLITAGDTKFSINLYDGTGALDTTSDEGEEDVVVSIWHNAGNATLSGTKTIAYTTQGHWEADDLKINKVGSLYVLKANLEPSTDVLGYSRPFNIYIPDITFDANITFLPGAASTDEYMISV